MKRLFLLLLISSAALAASAQDSTTGIPGRYLLLSVEAGAGLVGVGGVHLVPSGQTTGNSGISVWPTLQVRFMQMTQTWNYGLRTEVTAWGERNAITYTDSSGSPLGSADLYFASPAISIAPLLSRRILHTKKQELVVGVYAGATFSPYEAQGSNSFNNSKDFYFPSSIGFQMGAEVQYRYWVKPRLAISAAIGFQHNRMRYTEISDLGFNLNTIPVTAGVSFQL